MGRPAGWMKHLTGRDAMRSPGAPWLRREIERQFWKQVATGITSEKAAEAVGVSAGARWFRHRGGIVDFRAILTPGRGLRGNQRTGNLCWTGWRLRNPSMGPGAVSAFSRFRTQALDHPNHASLKTATCPSSFTA